MKKPISGNLQKIFVKKNDFTGKCLQKWNELSIRTHKEGTKKFDEIKRYIEQLRNGTFGQDKYINEDFFKNFRVPIAFLNRRYTSNQIISAIENLKYYFMEGYFPVKKDSFSKDLDVLIYNKKRGTSFLIVTLYKKPTPLRKNLVVNKDVQHLLDIADKNKEMLGGNFDKELLALNVKTIIDFKNNIPNHLFNVSKIKSEFGDIQKIFINYLNWISSKSWIELPVSIKSLNRDSKLFKKFIEEMEQNYAGYKLSNL